MTDDWKRALQSFVSDRELSDEELEQVMIAEFDFALGHPPRQRVPAGTVLLRSGDPVEVIRIVLEGSVSLSLPVGDHLTTFHSRTAGRIIGSMSIPHRSPAFFTVTAKTDLSFIEVGIGDLDGALEANPKLTAHFLSVLLRSMARRNRRSAELQTLVRELVDELAAERDRLQATLDELTRTQGRLIESEKLATLGQLAAGIGHELNNPAAAISRAADYVKTDTEALARALPNGESLATMLEAGYHPALRSTADERAARRGLGAAINDDALAARLVRIGIADDGAYRAAIADTPDHEARLNELESYYRLGSSLRTIASSADRIAALVRSVKAYARPDARWADNVDVHSGLEESLLLLGHETHDVTIERAYGDLPPIAGAPGELNQVWTNLLTNALEAMEGKGTINIVTRNVGNGFIEVDVIDSGHGIDQAHLDEVFEPSFTTRQGHVEFGLGLGLQIARDVVHRHSGTISVESEPGRTCFTVTLPVDAAPPGLTPEPTEGTEA